MNVSLKIIQSRFDDLVSGKIGREEVADWARNLREADDRRELTISPESDRSFVWKGILFLEGVDLRDSPNSYLHNEADIMRERPGFQ